MFFTDDERKHALIPKSETEIKWRCYQYCFTLQTIQFETPCQVSSIGQYAFARASSLLEITLPPSLRTIKSNAFHNCTSLTSINIPPLVQMIGPAAFLHCTSLLTVHCEFPSSLSAVSDSAFCQCSSLISISLPLNGLRYIGPRGFYGCSSLLSIGLAGGLVGEQQSRATMNATAIATSSTQNAELQVQSKAFTGCHELQRVVNTGSEEYSIMNNQSSYDIIEWLKQRFNNLPLHQVCYKPHVSIEQLHEGLGIYPTDILDTKNMSNSTTLETKIAVDRMGMTPLHVLICNPNVTIDLVKVLLEARPMLRYVETIQGLTVVDLYLICNNLQSFESRLSTLSLKSTNDDNVSVRDDGEEGEQTIKKHHHDHRLSLHQALEQGFSWKHIEFLSVLDTIFQEEQCQVDIKSRLFPFLKAATSENCSLEVIYNLAMNNVHDFI